MNFRRGRVSDEPEINLIPLIDVLLVILIFLMVTTTYSRFSELQINLPSADGEKPLDRPNEINVTVGGDGKYAVNQSPAAFDNPGAFSDVLQHAANGQTDPVIVISADANATHQAVINVMEAARIAGYSRVTFAAQAGRK